MFFSRFSRRSLNFQKRFGMENFKFNNMSSHEEQPVKKIRLNSGESIIVSPDVNTNNSEEITDKTVSSIKPNQMIRERDVGIIEYADPSIPGFLGVIKQRYSDFMVYEIDNARNIVHLTDFNIPKVEKSVDKPEVIEIPKEEISDEQIFQKMKTLLGEETSIQIQNLLNGQDENLSFVDTKVEKDKNKRKDIHQFFKEHFGNKLNTEAKDGVIRINMHTDKTRKDRRNKQQKNDIWNALGGSYCQFTLYKENRDTIEAINFLGKLLKVHSKTFSYAGTKDRRAITVQKVTANRIKAERLFGMNSNLRGMKLGNFKYVKDPLKLGDLRGNHFVITIRNVQVENEEIISKAMDSLQSRGFINYYGMQRFGSSTIPTFHVGRALLQNNWEEAVNLIMKPRPGDRQDHQVARQLWTENRDAKKALELFPKQCIAETHILSYFAKTGLINDFAGAFATIPRNLRLMYVHAYQSYIWNSIVSERIRIHGCSAPVVGDLIIKDEYSFTGIDNEDLMDDNFTVNSDDSKEIKVKVLTEEDLKNYSIFDVVLPLPGYSVIYPDNNIFEKYKELMWKDHLDPREMRRNVKELSLSGSYRKIMGKPSDLSWKIFKYDDPNISLSLTDLDLLDGKSEPESLPDGKNTALKINFSLPASSYATILLRELMKTTEKIEE
ncbi:pseudouridine synthase [Glomus cerebriforme]|uniref:Pseudouridine synthase n=1 Tax=Glomus cerebriforme TaxID=658196 RepID=A0A397TCL9_9GLOM|nr:pseudouridine synthase [Glomus cerebriforme]